ncbi:MAG: 50S ribosomal protein L1 [Dethiosulfovibrio peptidovorans]|nr:MAG: 50S ribosomal protein L1 [Dethiosulfovibrio peptidovorans]
MSKQGKRHAELSKKVDAQRQYSLDEAVSLVRENATAKFDESIEVHLRLGVDPRHADQQVRSTVVLPHGTGKTKQVLVITTGEKGQEAQEAGADFVGGEDMIQKIQGGWLDFDAVVATPDAMKLIGRLGKVLGPRGLMPSAKAGTVTQDVANAVTEIKAGKVEFRVDKYGIVHNAIGKASFSREQILDNLKAFYSAILKARPAAAKGTYVKSFAVSSTMGAGIKIDPSAAQKDVAE